MLDYKVAKYSHLTLFIKDIQNENDEKNFTLEIIDMDQFIKEGPSVNEDEKYYDGNNIEDEGGLSLEHEGIINRDVIIVPCLLSLKI